MEKLYAIGQTSAYVLISAFFEINQNILSIRLWTQLFDNVLHFAVIERAFPGSNM